MTAFLVAHPWLNLFLAGLGAASLVSGAFWIAVAVFGTARDLRDYDGGDEP